LHARLGEADEAERALHTYLELIGNSGGGGWVAASVNLFLNRTDEVIQFLQTGQLTAREIVMLRDDADWDVLRDDPRFQSLLKLPPTTDRK